MIKLGKGGKREVEEFMLTRYAFYLIAQNGDPKKEQIAFAQKDVRDLLGKSGIKLEELPA